MEVKEIKKVDNKILYDNYKMVHPDGTLMCFCSLKRANWYVDRGLAEFDEKNIVKLKFRPNGFGEPDVLLEGRKNICVMSGVTTMLTRHHVVPSQFRTHFDLKYKDKNSLDIVLLNRERHDEYEIMANDFKNRLEADFIIENGDLFEVEKEKYKEFAEARKASAVLNTIKARIPVDKQIYMQMRIDGILERYGVSIDEIKKLLINPENKYSKHIVEYFGTENLIVLWKLHFIKYAKPQFLPEYWKPNMIKIITKNGYNTQKNDIVIADFENNTELLKLIKKYDLYETAKLYI